MTDNLDEKEITPETAEKPEEQPREAVEETTAEGELADKVMKKRDIGKISKRQLVGKIFVQIGLYTFLTVMALVVLFPFYWMLISSLKTLDEYNARAHALAAAVQVVELRGRVRIGRAQPRQTVPEHLYRRNRLGDPFARRNGFVGVCVCAARIQREKRVVCGASRHHDDSGRALYNHQLRDRSHLPMEEHLYGTDCALPRQRVLYLSVAAELYADSQ